MLLRPLFLKLKWINGDILQQIMTHFLRPNRDDGGTARATGQSRTKTSFIHRVNTGRGIAPKTGCAEVTNVWATALVPYKADYVFYRAIKQP